MAFLSKAKLISVSIETGETGMLFATSREMKALFVIARDDQELKLAIPSAIIDIFQSQGIDVSVYEVVDETMQGFWVIIGEENKEKHYDDL